MTNAQSNSPGRYSLLDVVTDGPLRAPRWLHHVVKILTSTLIALAIILVPPHCSPVVAALVGGPVFWLLAAVHEHFRPSDPEPLTTWQHVADWMTDCALSTVPLAFALRGPEGLLLLGACVLAYLAGHKDARP